MAETCFLKILDIFQIKIIILKGIFDQRPTTITKTKLETITHNSS